MSYWTLKFDLNCKTSQYNSLIIQYGAPPHSSLDARALLAYTLAKIRLESMS